MNIEKLIKKTIKRYLNGKSPIEIYQNLGKGKTWLFNWLKRYKLDGANWAKKHSRKLIRVRKKLIGRKNIWLLLQERNWKINYTNRSEPLPLVIS
ncbi:MAG: hypothetical protein PHD33_02145 [Atribacterota bacterium]|nr:hypothetical protein [Atribacterota bacterium]